MTTFENGDRIGMKHRHTCSRTVPKPSSSQTETPVSQPSPGSVGAMDFLLGLQVAGETWKLMIRHGVDLPIIHAGLLDGVWVLEEVKGAVQWV